MFLLLFLNSSFNFMREVHLNFSFVFRVFFRHYLNHYIDVMSLIGLLTEHKNDLTTEPLSVLRLVISNWNHNQPWPISLTHILRAYQDVDYTTDCFGLVDIPMSTKLETKEECDYPALHYIFRSICFLFVSVT